MDISRLTNMFDSRFIPQMIESPVESIIRKIEGDTETYICNRLMELNIDKDILMNQTQEIKRLNGVIAEYERLEEQGLLLRLPCKVGDTVYLVDFEENDYDEATVLSIEIDTRENRILINSDYETGTWSEDSYVFYSQEEAELELANRQQSHAEAIIDERNGR